MIFCISNQLILCISDHFCFSTWSFPSVSLPDFFCISDYWSDSFSIAVQPAVPLALPPVRSALQMQQVGQGWSLIVYYLPWSFWSPSPSDHFSPNFWFFSCYKCFADEATLLEHIPKHKESKHLKASAKVGNIHRGDKAVKREKIRNFDFLYAKIFCLENQYFNPTIRV